MKKQNRQAASGAAQELRAVLISGFLNEGVHLNPVVFLCRSSGYTRALL